MLQKNNSKSLNFDKTVEISVEKILCSDKKIEEFNDSIYITSEHNDKSCQSNKLEYKYVFNTVVI